MKARTIKGNSPDEIKLVLQYSIVGIKWKGYGNNDHKLTPDRFEWQDGYGVFSYGQSQVDKVYKYIQNQEVHHKKETFKDEYLKFLKKFKVEYDEQFIFQDLT